MKKLRKLLRNAKNDEAYDKILNNAMNAKKPPRVDRNMGAPKYIPKLSK